MTNKHEEQPFTMTAAERITAVVECAAGLSHTRGRLSEGRLGWCYMAPDGTMRGQLADDGTCFTVRRVPGGYFASYSADWPDGSGYSVFQGIGRTMAKAVEAASWNWVNTHWDQYGRVIGVDGASA